MNNYNSYFDFRSVGEDTYVDYAIPAYLINVLPADCNSRILDIGCGIGQLLEALRRNGYAKILGIDVSKNAVSLCNAKGLPVEHIDDLSTFCMSCDRKFDFIVMSHVIEHLPKEQIIDILQLIRTRLLETGGSFVVMTPNAQSNSGCYWAYEDFTHTVMFTAGSLKYVLLAAGYKYISFLDPQGTEGTALLVSLVRSFFLQVYRWKVAFWNRVTRSAFHRPSPQIFTYDLKVLAK